MTKYLFDNGLISTLQVWIEQYDPESKNAFYSEAPVGLGLYPVNDARGFQQWHFEAADQFNIRVDSCNYPATLRANDALTVLGDFLSSERTSILLAAPANTPCGHPLSFQLPTAALQRTQVVLLAQDRTKLSSPIALQTATLRPYFEEPRITPHRQTPTPGAQTPPSL